MFAIMTRWCAALVLKKEVLVIIFFLDNTYLKIPRSDYQYWSEIGEISNFQYCTGELSGSERERVCVCVCEREYRIRFAL